MLSEFKGINASLFFYKKNEYFIPQFFGDVQFKFEGINITDNPISSFSEILSNYYNIQSIISNAINSIKNIDMEKNLLNFIYDIKEKLVKIHKYFETFDIAMEILFYISSQEKILEGQNRKKSKEKLVKEFLERYYSDFYQIKTVIDTYYNINNDKLLSTLSSEKRIFFSNAKRIDLLGRLIIPKSQRFYCIEYKNKLLPPESFMPNIYDLTNYSNEEFEELYNNKSINSLEYKYILKHNIIDIIVYDIHSFYDFLKAYYDYLTTNNFHLNKCKNCGKYFIPSNKINETLCDNIFKNRKNL